MNSKQFQKEHSILEIMKSAIGASRQFIYTEDQYLVNIEAANELVNSDHMSDNKTNDELIRRWTKAITVKVHEGNRIRYLN